MKVADALKDVHVLAVDTAPFIYFLEKDVNYFAIAEGVFQYITRESLLITAATLTLTEVLMKPIQAGNADLQKSYRELAGQYTQCITDQYHSSCCRTSR